MKTIHCYKTVHSTFCQQLFTNIYIFVFAMDYKKLSVCIAACLRLAKYLLSLVRAFGFTANLQAPQFTLLDTRWLRVCRL